MGWGLTSNYFSMMLDRKDIEMLYIYLCYVTKKLIKIIQRY